MYKSGGRISVIISATAATDVFSASRYQPTPVIMIKSVLLCVLLASCALAAATGRSAAELAARRALPALQHEEVHDEAGQYALRYVTAEGTVVSERGYLIDTPQGERVMIYEGESTWFGPDGKKYVTKYSAGPDGAKFEGEHLPKAPEV